MKKIRLIAIDLDGTLVRSDQTISSHTADIVIRAQQQGVKVAIVSGRPTYGAEPAARILELEKYGGYLVSYNGAEIYECTTKHMLHSATLPRCLTNHIQHSMRTQPCTYDLYRQRSHH